jgi:hypothetical protein
MEHPDQDTFQRVYLAAGPIVSAIRTRQRSRQRTQPNQTPSRHRPEFGSGSQIGEALKVGVLESGHLGAVLIDAGCAGERAAEHEEDAEWVSDAGIAPVEDSVCRAVQDDVRVVRVVGLSGGRDLRSGECGGRPRRCAATTPAPAAGQVGLNGGVSKYGDDQVQPRAAAGPACQPQAAGRWPSRSLVQRGMLL